MDPAALTCFLLLRSFKVVGKNQNIPQKVVYKIEMYDESKTSPSTNKVKSNNFYDPTYHRTGDSERPQSTRKLHFIKTI